MLNIKSSQLEPSYHTFPGGHTKLFTYKGAMRLFALTQWIYKEMKWGHEKTGMSEKLTWASGLGQVEDGMLSKY